MKTTKFIAFRGHAIEAPPNSSAAINIALDNGVDGIYLDLNYTKDEKIVCNGEFGNSSLKKYGLTRGLTYGEIKEIDVGKELNYKYNNEKILSVEEAFELIGDKADIYLGLISGSRWFPNVEERILDFLDDRKLINKVTILSFDHMALRWIKKINSSSKTVAMHFSRPSKPIDFALDVMADGIASFYYFLTTFVIETAHREMLEVYSFPINNKGDLESMVEIGVDGILSPDTTLMKALK